MATISVDVWRREIRTKYLSRAILGVLRHAIRHTIISRHLLNKQTDRRLFLLAYFRLARMCQDLVST